MRSKLLLLIVICSVMHPVFGQDSSKVKNLEIYGFAMTDIGYNFDQINPAWFDALRVTKLPVSKNQFGSNGNTYFSVRQTRFGVKGFTPTPLGELTAVFDFDLFGVGVDEGQTTMRVRNAYGEIGRVRQTPPLWTVMFFPTRSSIGDPPAWYFSGIYRCVMLPCRAKTSCSSRWKDPVPAPIREFIQEE